METWPVLEKGRVVETLRIFLKNIGIKNVWVRRSSEGFFDPSTGELATPEDPFAGGHELAHALYEMMKEKMPYTWGAGTPEDWEEYGHRRPDSYFHKYEEELIAYLGGALAQELPLKRRWEINPEDVKETVRRVLKILKEEVPLPVDEDPHTSLAMALGLTDPEELREFFYPLSALAGTEFSRDFLRLFLEFPYGHGDPGDAWEDFHRRLVKLLENVNRELWNFSEPAHLRGAPWEHRTSRGSPES